MLHFSKVKQKVPTWKIPSLALLKFHMILYQGKCAQKLCSDRGNNCHPPSASTVWYFLKFQPRDEKSWILPLFYSGVLQVQAIHAENSLSVRNAAVFQGLVELFCVSDQQTVLSAVLLVQLNIGLITTIKLMWLSSFYCGHRTSDSFTPLQKGLLFCLSFAYFSALVEEMKSALSWIAFVCI